MKTVTIPNTANPWTCSINGRKYSYAAGTEQSVPDEVAELIHSLGLTNRKPAAAEQPWTPHEVTGYVNDRDIKAYAKTSEVMPAGEDIQGYANNKDQTLQHDNAGTVKWVDNPANVGGGDGGAE